jgi:DNA-binding CsgD family transcriptional regulator
MFETWHGRMLLRAGRLSEARAALEGSFVLEDGTHAVAVLAAAGIVALGRVAIHTGDRRETRRLGGIARIMLQRGTPTVQRHAGWLLALLSMADGDPEAACEWLRAPRDSDGRPLMPRSRFPLEIADEVPLAHIALATGDDELAQLALSISQRRAELNPGIHSIEATAAHVRGLLERNQADLEAAVDLFGRGSRLVELATALEDLGVALLATDHRAAIDVLGRALALWTDLGATWDARRVRSRLREHGVRRRLGTAEPETSGWGAMTKAELAVSRLVAEGLTNKEVAERLFVSPHTVNSHLRHVFSKLGINSRVELALLAREYEMALIV